MPSIEIDDVIPFFRDQVGDPLENGFIYIGEVNKDPTVLQFQSTVYSDFNLTQPLAQPLRTRAGRVLNNSGNPTKFYVDATNYSQVIQDKNQNLVQFNSRVLDSTDQEAVIAEVNAFDFMTEEQIADVSSFTGALDVTVALQTGLDFLDNLGGGVFYMPPGKYTISTLVRPGNFTRVNGSGYATWVIADGISTFTGSWPTDITSAGMFTVYQKVGVEITNIRIDGNSSVKNDAEAYGLHFQEATDFVIHSIWIQNMPSDAASLQRGGDGMVFQDADLTDNPCERGTVAFFHIENCLRQGWTATFAFDMCISNGTIKSQPGALECIDIEPNASDEIRNLTFSNVHCRDGQFGVAVSGAGPISQISYTGGTIRGCREGAIVVTPSSSGTKPKNIAISNVVMTNNNTNNTILANSEGDISIKAEGVVVTGCFGSDGGTSGMRIWDSSNVKVTGCTFKNYRYSGIWVNPDRGTSGTVVNDISLDSNTCINNGQDATTHYGIRLEDGTSGRVITGLYLGNNNLGDNQSSATQAYGLGIINTNSDQLTWAIPDNLYVGNVTGAIQGTVDELTWQTLVISAGNAITIPSRPGRQRVFKFFLDPSTSTTLDTINGLEDAQEVILRNIGNTAITCTNGVGNLRSGGVSQSLNSTRDIIKYIGATDLAEVLMTSFVNNA